MTQPKVITDVSELTPEQLQSTIKTDIAKVIQNNVGNKITTELSLGMFAQINSILSNGFKLYDQFPPKGE